MTKGKNFMLNKNLTKCPYTLLLYIYILMRNMKQVLILKKMLKNYTYIYCKDLKIIIINYNCIFIHVINKSNKKVGK